MGFRDPTITDREGRAVTSIMLLDHSESHINVQTKRSLPERRDGRRDLLFESLDSPVNSVDELSIVPVGICAHELIA